MTVGWFSKRPPGPTEADKAVKASTVSKARQEARWEHVTSTTGFLKDQLERNHLAERLEAAMTLKGPA